MARVKKSFLNPVILTVAFLTAVISFADPGVPPKTVKQLIRWETGSNAVASRSDEVIALTHYEIPLDEITADISKNIDPAVYSSLVFKKDGKEYVRWVINPEDTKWHLKVAEFLKKKKLDATPKQYFSAYLTSSRSLIVVDPVSGATFSAKASTNNTGGNWTDKKQPFDDARQARRSSDMVSDVQKRVKFKHIVLLEEPGMFGIESVDQAVLIRSLGDLPKSENYYLPGFSAVHDQTGREIALKNGSKNPAVYWNEHYNKTLGRAYAELSAHFGLTYDSPHSQNFLVELDKNWKPTGRIVFRDFVDGYAQDDFLKAADQSAFLKTWDPDNISRGDLNAAVGIMHGNEYPSWLNDKTYKKWGSDFYAAYEAEFSKLTGISTAELKKTELTQSGRYFGKYYDVGSAAWKKYLKLADCYFGFIKTRAGLDCPEHLRSKVTPEFRTFQVCSALLGPAGPGY